MVHKYFGLRVHKYFGLRAHKYFGFYRYIIRQFFELAPWILNSDSVLSILGIIILININYLQWSLKVSIINRLFYSVDIVGLIILLIFRN
jgi:hypothetical protein